MKSITLNGQQQNVADGSSISDLLPVIGVDSQQVAVVVNSKIVRPEERDKFILDDNDDVDILIFAGGG
ncbi:MAG: sulfur carrier protein ThiS [Chlorobiaceae bacterium]|nr:sulfur carrier protein ThiS [Chlorobiaceae bacterium]